MEIKILGTGCSGCATLLQTVQEAVNELQITATVTKEEDMATIIAYNVMKLPAMVIDEKVVSSGRKLSLDQVKAILTTQGQK